MTLKELEIGKSAVIETVGGSGELRQHFTDMGMIPGAEVTVIKLAPMGDPWNCRCTAMNLRCVWRKRIRSRSHPYQREQENIRGLDRVTDAEHPGLG